MQRFEKLYIFVIQLDIASGLMSFIWKLGDARPYGIGVVDSVGEVACDSVFQSVAGRKQDYQHEDSPRDGESSEHCPQLVTPEGHKNLRPKIPVEHLFNLFCEIHFIGVVFLYRLYDTVFQMHYFPCQRCYSAFVSHYHHGDACGVDVAQYLHHFG